MWPQQAYPSAHLFLRLTHKSWTWQNWWTKDKNIKTRDFHSSSLKSRIGVEWRRHICNVRTGTKSSFETRTTTGWIWFQAGLIFMSAGSLPCKRSRVKNKLRFQIHAIGQLSPVTFSRRTWLPLKMNRKSQTKMWHFANENLSGHISEKEFDSNNLISFLLYWFAHRTKLNKCQV